MTSSVIKNLWMLTLLHLTVISCKKPLRFSRQASSAGRFGSREEESPVFVFVFFRQKKYPSLVQYLFTLKCISSWLEWFFGGRKKWTTQKDARDRVPFQKNTKEGEKFHCQHFFFKCFSMIISSVVTSQNINQPYYYTTVILTKNTYYIYLKAEKNCVVDTLTSSCPLSVFITF